MLWLDDAALRAQSNGAILKPETYNYRTYLPETDGLYCTRVFGPVAWSEGELRLAEDDRRERWGHLELPEPVARREGPSRSVMLVVPPAYRRFRLLSPEQHRAFARTRRAELVALDAEGKWPYCDPLEQLLAEEGLSTEAGVESRDEGAVEPALNSAYRAVVNHAHRLRQMAEFGAPEPVLEPTRAALRAACDRVDVELGRLAELPDAVRRLALGQRT